MTAEFPPINFKTWLQSTPQGDNPNGDLIADMRHDRTLPDNFTSFAEFESYLIDEGACSQALDCAKPVWKRFEKWKAAQ